MDGLRLWALATQAIGFSLIIGLESSALEHPGRWQALVLSLMLVSALAVMLVRRYRNNRARRARDQRHRQTKK